MFALVKTTEEEKECVSVKCEQQETAIQEELAAQTIKCQPFVSKALSLMEQPTNKVITITKDTIYIIHHKTGHKHFIIDELSTTKYIISSQTIVCQDDD